MQPQQQFQTPQHLPKQKKIILLVVFGVLGLIVIISVIAGITAKKSHAHGPTSIIPVVNSTQIKARDVQRETDIKALHAQVEAYWAQNGFYPSFDNMNSATFIYTNLKGLDLAALKDPYGTDSKFVKSPQADAYSYDVLPSNCDNTKTQCTSYTLTATLEGDINGSSTFVKQSLNN